ncbi:DUF6346 domain-containing protein [Plantactinospora sp. ZYX-F-223]|uniref:DUF6346 domain-containing protein n=1 Tax=Plantactinospora sp. ZYX-F-223 TaxID=3144103 RepID=UPI0031FE10B6
MYAENEPGPARPPVRSPARHGRFARAAGYLALLLAIFLFAELSMTAAMFTGTDFDDAERTGQATVRSCERYGPVGHGFGYWAECRAEVVWSDGDREVLTPGKRGFFSVDEVGTTVTIGDLGYSRGGRSLAREERPPRPLATVVAAAFAMIAVLLALAMLWVLWDSLRTGVRRLVRVRPTDPGGPHRPAPVSRDRDRRV